MPHELPLTETSNLNGSWIDEKIKAKIVELASRLEDPFYLYDTKQIKDVCSQFMAIPYQHKHIHFATMANIHPQFLNILKSAGISVFVNSIEHLKIALECGFASDEIIFTASAMSEKSMRMVANKVAQVNLDSVSQLETWFRLFPAKPVGIRCNLGEMTEAINTHAGYFIGKESRLGLSPIEIRLLKGNRQINGLHLYVGTNILDIDYFLRCYRSLAKMVSYFPNIQYLNLGGGFGISENGSASIALEEYGHKVTELMNSISEEVGRPLNLYLEPGRIIGGRAGYFVGKVTDVKARAEHTFVGLNASSVQFPRPLFYPESAVHPVMIIRDERFLQFENVRRTSVYGCSTYSRDFLVRNSLLPKIQLNDTLVLGNAGSYCASAFTHFLGFPKPAEYFI